MTQHNYIIHIIDDNYINMFTQFDILHITRIYILLIYQYNEPNKKVQTSKYKLRKIHFTFVAQAYQY